MGRILDLVFDIILFVVVEQVLARAISRLMGGGVRFSHPGFRPRPKEKKEPLRGEAVRDPVCGMFLSKDLAHHYEWRGQLFCSRECLEKYKSQDNA